MGHHEYRLSGKVIKLQLLRGLRSGSRGPTGPQRQGPLRFWTAALCTCVGKVWCRRFSSQEDRLVVRPDGPVARVAKDDGDPATDRGVIDLGGTGMPDLGKRRLLLRLPESAALKTISVLPAVLRPNLTQAVKNELDRLTPFTHEQVYFTLRELEQQGSAEQIRFELCLTRRENVDPWLERLARAGHPVDMVDVEGGWEGWNLLPYGKQPENKKGSLLTGFLLLLALALTVLALALPLYQKRETVIALSDQMRVAQQKANRVLTLRQSLQESRDSAQVVIKRRANTVSVTETLAEITRILPDDTWVQNMDLKSDRLQLRGETDQASALIALLENSDLLRDVGFSSPVVQVRQSQKQRFHISAKLVNPGE